MQECGAHDSEDGIQRGQEPEECQPGHLPLRPASAGSLIAVIRAVGLLFGTSSFSLLLCRICPL